MAISWTFNPFTGTLDAISSEAADLATHIADSTNPHSVTFTQSVAADGATDISAAEAEELTDGSVTSLHSHAGGGYTDEDAQDAVGTILTDTTTIDFTYTDGAPTIEADVIPGGVDHNSLDNLDVGDVHTQYLNETRHDGLASDNPHSVTFTQAVTADGTTDISGAEAETLTDTSNADALHEHAASNITVDDTNFTWFSSTDQQSWDEELDAFLFTIYPPAEQLDDMDIDTSGVSGKLSFGASNSVPGYTNCSGIGSRPAVDINEAFNDSGDRAGIFTGSADWTGTLNEDAASTDNYPANSFRDIGQTLYLELNGTIVRTLDLSSETGAVNDGTSTSGFNIIAKTQGTDTPFFYRTGSYRIDSGDVNLVSGWNYCRVYDNQGTPQSTNYVDWIKDVDYTNATSFSGETLDNLSMAGSKWLSGVQWYTSGDADYDITISNAYRNSYSSSASALNYSGTNCTASDSSIPNMSDETDDITITNKTVTINATRLVDGDISMEVQVDRTLASDLTSTGATISSILMDNASASPTDTYDDFDDEGYRLPSNFSITSTSYSSGPNNGPVTWDETISLISATAGYSDGLQVVNDRVEYPDYDWSSVTYQPGTAPNYTTASGDRVYIRYFYNASSRQNFLFNFNVTSSTFVSVATGPSSNNITCELLAPNTTQDGVGTIEWKDAVTAYTDDDSIGCYSSSVGSTIPTNWGVTLGTRSTSTSGYAWCIRITAAAAWAGRINSVTCSPQ